MSEAIYPSDVLFPDVDLFPMPSDDEYENWQAFQGTTVNDIDIDALDAGFNYEVQVRAVSSDGIASDWTPSVFITTPTDVTPPSIPSVPVVASKLGGFTITWDGRTSNGGTMESDFAYVKVLANGELITTFNARTGGSTAWTDTKYGTDYSFTLVSVDTSGNESEPSQAVTLQVTPLVSEDMIGKLINGATMVVDGSIGTDQLAAKSVTALQIAAGAIEADKIKVGALDGMTIEGLTIKAVNSLAVGKRSAYNDGAQGWWFSETGFANINDSTGSTFVTINPNKRYFQIGDTSSGYLKYSVATGELEMHGSFRTNSDSKPRVVIDNTVWSPGAGPQGPAIGLFTMDQGDGANNHGPKMWSNNTSWSPGGDLIPTLAVGAYLIDLPAVDVATDPNNVGYWSHFSVAPRSAMLRTRQDGKLTVATELAMYDDILLKTYVGNLTISMSSSQGDAWLTLNDDAPDLSGQWDLSSTDSNGNYSRRFWTDSNGMHLQGLSNGVVATWIDMNDGGHIEFGNNSNWGGTPTNSKFIFVGGFPDSNAAGESTWVVRIGQSGQLYADYTTTK